MGKSIYRVIFVIILISSYISVFPQVISDSTDTEAAIIDSLRNTGIIFNYNTDAPHIELSNDQAIKFLQHKIQPQYWNDITDPLRQALGHLIFEASHPPYDSTEYLLQNYPFDSLSIPWDKFYIWEPLRLKIPVISPPPFPLSVDTTLSADSNKVSFIPDTLKTGILPLSDLLNEGRPGAGLKDTTIMVIIDTLDEVSSSYSRFPFRYFNYPYQSDSIKVAVNSLLEYLEERDSSIISFTGITDERIPVWLNSKSDRMMRYWLKNEFSDSVTIWIGSPYRNTIGLYLEHGVSFRRPVKQGNISDARINVEALDNSKLLDVQKIIVKPQYWRYRAESLFQLNQASLSNWVKGGENSISTAMDITGYADYNNKNLKLSSNNFGRLKLGFLASGGNPIRKNLDLLETNSKLNHKAFGKFDFSGILLFKTQVARGYNYPNDSVPVSKFMNPAILTIGIGLDYKPNKETSINFSPLSYKGTFVPDTATIDQTKYGILKDRRSKNEPGVSFMITNTYKPLKNLSLTNRLQLFTNYIDHPFNIDVDWEMIAVVNLNWFTDVRFNTHLIFDDNTKTVELDKDRKPVKRPDGTEKKTARIQFKEMLGFSFIFRF